MSVAFGELPDSPYNCVHTIVTSKLQRRAAFGNQGGRQQSMAVQFVLSRDVLGLPSRFDARPNDFCMQNEEEILRLLSGLLKKADTSMIILLDFDCSGSRDSGT
jgi:hypothetical protein